MTFYDPRQGKIGGLKSLSRPPKWVKNGATNPDFGQKTARLNGAVPLWKTGVASAVQSHEVLQRKFRVY